MQIIIIDVIIIGVLVNLYQCRTIRLWFGVWMKYLEHIKLLLLKKATTTNPQCKESNDNMYIWYIELFVMIVILCA